MYYSSMFPLLHGPSREWFMSGTHLSFGGKNIDQIKIPFKYSNSIPATMCATVERLLLLPQLLQLVIR